MAILDEAKFKEALKSLVGDRTDDEAIKIQEDMLDTFANASADNVAKLEQEIDTLKNEKSH